MLSDIQSPSFYIHIIPIIGGPGCGKGSQCTKLSKEKHLLHLSTGELLRKNTKDNTKKLSLEIQSKINKGELISSELMMKVVNERLRQIQKESVVLLDGFPRNKENLLIWRKEKLNNVKVPMIWYFNCPDELMIKRIAERNNEGRNDSDREVVIKRIKLFREETEPIIEELRAEKGFHEIDLTKSIDEVDKVLSDLLKESHLL